MSFAALAIMNCVLMAAAGLAITQPEELREHRYTKIILSLPLVVLVTSVFHELQAIQGYFAMFSIGILAFIWRSPLAHFASLVFLRLLHGNMNQPTGIEADIPASKALYRNGDHEEAIRHLEGELEKEPHHFEGLLLLSEWYGQHRGPKRSLQPLETILSRTPLSEEQRAMVAGRKTTIEQQILLAELNRK